MNPLHKPQRGMSIRQMTIHPVFTQRLLESTSTMNTSPSLLMSLVSASLVLSLGACAGMSEQEKGTAIGAGAGAVGGAILSGGSAIGTVGGAAVGGIIGHEVSKH